MNVDQQTTPTCPSLCGQMYQRDGKWWCLNNYCEHSYFFDHKQSRSKEQLAVVEWFHNNGGTNTDVWKSFRRLEMEANELATSIIDNASEKIREEAADVGICLMLLSQLAGFDLLEAIRWKQGINNQRRWMPDDNGCLSHIKGSDPRDQI